MVPVEEFCRGGCFIELSISDYTQNNNRTMYNIMAIVEFFSQNLYFNGVVMEKDDFNKLQVFVLRNMIYFSD